MATLVNYTCKRFIKLTPDDKFYHIYSDFVASASCIPDTLKYPKMQHIHGMHPVGCKEQSIDLNIFSTIPCLCDFCGCCLKMHVYFRTIILF